MDSIRKALLIATMLSAPLAAVADTVYTTEADFNAATDIIGTDNFADITPQGFSAPIDRTLVGGFAYTASSPDATWIVDTDPTAGVLPALSTNFDTDSLTVDNFGADINAISGYFFGTDVDGNILASSLQLIIDLSIGSALTFNLDPSTSPTFWGFAAAEGFITALTVASFGGAYPTIGSLAFGNTAAVVPPPPPVVDPGAGTDPGPVAPDPVNAPAPGVLGLLLLGLAGALRARRQSVSIA